MFPPVSLSVAAAQALSRQIVEPEVYERVRPRYLSFMVELRRRRRRAVGDALTVLFENTETLLAQLHEQMRFEDGWSEPWIARWLADYASLIAPPGELAATLFVDGGGPEFAQALAGGLNDHDSVLHLRLEDASIPAFAPAPAGAGAVVHFVRFQAPLAAVRRLRRKDVPAWLELRTGGEVHTAPLSLLLREQMEGDLNGTGSAVSHLGRLAATARRAAHGLAAFPWAGRPRTTAPGA